MTNPTNNKESNLSKHSQMRVPDDSGTFDAHEGVSIYDTNDIDLLTQISKDFVSKDQVILTENADGTTTFTKYPLNVTPILEPYPSSDESESTEVFVVVDDSNIFFFDKTEGNERIHLKHKTGTYFTIHPDGSYVLKSQKNYLQFVKGDYKLVVANTGNIVTKKELNINSGSHANFTFEGHHNLSVSGSFTQKTNGTVVLKSGSDRLSFVEGSDIEDIKGSKIITTGDSIILESKNAISLKAKEIKMTQGSSDVTYGGSSIETVMGAKSIGADLIEFTAQNHLALVSTGDMNTSIGGVHKETIGGVSFNKPAEQTTKDVTILKGNYMIKLLLGDYDLLAVAGKIALTSITGVDLISSAIRLGGPAAIFKPLYGDLFIDSFYSTHSHPTGTGPSGPPVFSPPTSTVTSSIITLI